MLAADDSQGTVALGRATGNAAAVTVVNRSGSARTVSVPVGGYLTEGTTMTPGYVVGGTSAPATVSAGVLEVQVPARGGVVLVAKGIDRTPPAAPSGLTVTREAATEVGLSWTAVAGASGYDVFTSPVTGGGYIRANTDPVTGTTFTLTGLTTGQPVFVVVRARDSVGNLSAASNEVEARPQFTIGWANLQWPPTLTHTISAVNRTDNVYGQVWIDGITNQPGATPTLRAQLGFGPTGSNPDGNAGWAWVDASFNTNAGNNDEFVASLLPEATGSFDYAYRYSTTGGRAWVYADLDGISNGYSPEQAGKLTVTSSGDTTAPDTPTGLRVTSADPEKISLAWDAVSDPGLAFYEVLRAPSAAEPFDVIGSTSGTEFIDTRVTENSSYAYKVRAVDTSFNRSEPSAPVTATAELRTVSVSFTVTVPATTDASGRTVHIAGFLDRLDGNLPSWDPAGVVLTPRGRHDLADHPHRQGDDVHRVQVHARGLGTRREGRELRRDRQQAAHADLRELGNTDGQ